MSTDTPATGTADPLGLHGIVPPTITAFDEDQSVDLEATAAHARFVVDAGVHGVFPLGTNGEFALLDDGERDAVVGAVVDAVGSEVPVIAGVGAPGTRRTIDRARAAVDAGVDGVVAVTPYYYPMDSEALYTHYRAIADAISVPIYVYHIPSKTGNSIDLDTLADIAGIEGIAGVKDSSKDVPWLAQAIAATPELSFLSGSDSLVVPGLDIGCSGVVSAIANAFPEYIVSLYEAYVGGDRERAKARQAEVFEIRRALKAGPYLSGIKTALSLRDDLDFEPGPLRRPLRGMDDEEQAALRAELTEHGLL